MVQLMLRDYKTRIGISKLKSFSDGWGHLRFMLIYSPLWLFVIPGIILLLTGILSLIGFYSNYFILTENKLIQLIFISIILTLLGYQLIFFGAFAKSYAINHLNEKSKFMEKLYRIINLEKGSIIGILLILLGIIFSLFTINNILNNPKSAELKSSLLALTLITLGIQTIFSSFMLSILSIKPK